MEISVVVGQQKRRITLKVLTGFSTLVLILASLTERQGLLAERATISERDDRIIQLQNVAESQLIDISAEQQRSVWSVAFSPDE